MPKVPEVCAYGSCPTISTTPNAETAVVRVYGVPGSTTGQAPEGLFHKMDNVASDGATRPNGVSVSSVRYPSSEADVTLTGIYLNPRTLDSVPKGEIDLLVTKKHIAD